MMDENILTQSSPLNLHSSKNSLTQSKKFNFTSESNIKEKTRNYKNLDSNYITQVNSNYVPNSTFNIKEKIKTILDELTPRNSNPVKMFDNRGEGKMNVGEVSRKSSLTFFNDKQVRTEKVRSNSRVNRELQYFVEANKLNKKEVSRSFNRPVVDVNIPALSINSKNLILNSPTQKNHLRNSDNLKESFNEIDRSSTRKSSVGMNNRSENTKHFNLSYQNDKHKINKRSEGSYLSKYFEKQTFVLTEN